MPSSSFPTFVGVGAFNNEEEDGGRYRVDGSSVAVRLSSSWNPEVEALCVVEAVRSPVAVNASKFPPVAAMISRVTASGSVAQRPGSIAPSARGGSASKSTRHSSLSDPSGIRTRDVTDEFHTRTAGRSFMLPLLLPPVVALLPLLMAFPCHPTV